MSNPTNKNVLIDREKYIGGSDIPAIMGISPFKTRWQLLQEKAGLVEPEIVDNAYVDYGSEMEKHIRDYVNFLDEYRKNQFVEDTLIKEEKTISVRCNVDGRNSDTILEIKTTSHICEEPENWEKFYRVYLVQLLYYMFYYEYEKGILAIYERPKDFNTDFDPDQLMLYNINIRAFRQLVDEIRNKVFKFMVDLKKLKENPNLQEKDFIPVEIVNYVNEIQEVENKLKLYRDLEKYQEDLRTKLYESMLNADIKSWTTPNNIKITLVEEIPTSVIQEEKFDEETFKNENEELYNKYLKTFEKKKSGKKGFVRITMGKEE